MAGKDTAYIIAGIGAVVIAGYLVYSISKPLKDALGGASKVTVTLADTASKTVEGAGKIADTTLTSTNDTLRALGGQGGKLSPLGVAVVGTGATIGAVTTASYLAPKIANIANVIRGGASVASNSVKGLYTIGVIPAFTIIKGLGLGSAFSHVNSPNAGLSL